MVSRKLVRLLNTRSAKFSFLKKSSVTELFFYQKVGVGYRKIVLTAVVLNLHHEYCSFWD
jgi:hypothetical protein